MLSVFLDVDSISSHSFEARELRFGTQTPHLNAKKHTEWIFEILAGQTSLKTIYHYHLSRLHMLILRCLQVAQISLELPKALENL